MRGGGGVGGIIVSKDVFHIHIMYHNAVRAQPFIANVKV